MTTVASVPHDRPEHFVRRMILIWFFYVIFRVVCSIVFHTVAFLLMLAVLPIVALLDRDGGRRLWGEVRRHFDLGWPGFLFQPELNYKIAHQQRLQRRSKVNHPDYLPLLDNTAAHKAAATALDRFRRGEISYEECMGVQTRALALSEENLRRSRANAQLPRRWW